MLPKIRDFIYLAKRHLASPFGLPLANPRQISIGSATELNH
jgi:hypothetical protein